MNELSNEPGCMTHCFRCVTDASIGSLCFTVPGQGKAGHRQIKTKSCSAWARNADYA
jgi:hypothetical protein